MSKSVLISGVIITFNEERNISRCLESLVDVCDEIIVVDSFSTDKTKDICSKFDVRFIENAWKGFLDQKNFAQNSAKYDHVLQLDADEELTGNLKQSILNSKENWNRDGYFFNRYTLYCDKWIKHSGWYPDSKLRLYDRRKGNWQGFEPHPQVIMADGATIGTLRGDLNHYSYTSYEDHINRSAKYAKQAAISMKQLNKNASIAKLVVSPFYRFINDYFFRGGFRDGFEGFIICRTASYYTFLKYMYLRLINKGKDIE